MVPARKSDISTGPVKLDLQKKQNKPQAIEVFAGPSMILVPQDFDESYLIRIVKSLRSIA